MSASQRLMHKKWLLHSVTRRKNFYLHKVKLTSLMADHLARYSFIYFACKGLDLSVLITCFSNIASMTN